MIFFYFASGWKKGWLTTIWMSIKSIFLVTKNVSCSTNIYTLECTISLSFSFVSFELWPCSWIKVECEPLRHSFEFHFKNSGRWRLPTRAYFCDKFTSSTNDVKYGNAIVRCNLRVRWPKSKFSVNPDMKHIRNFFQFFKKYI